MKTNHTLDRLSYFLGEMADNLSYFESELPDVNLSGLKGEIKKSKVYVDALIKNSEDQHKNRLNNILVPGNIIMITGTDGISYNEKTYYKITEVTETKVSFETIKVTKGDYYNKIGYESSASSGIEDFLEYIYHHESNYSIKLEGNEEAWNKYYNYCKDISM